MKKENVTYNGLNEIRDNISGFKQSIADIDILITNEIHKKNGIIEQIDNYTDLDNESGYLALKQELRTSEDRIEFLEKRKRAVSINEADLEADRIRFRQEQEKMITSGREAVITKVTELLETMDRLEKDVESLDRIIDLWTITYKQQAPIQRGYLSDNTGILMAVVPFAKSMKAKLHR